MKGKISLPLILGLTLVLGGLGLGLFFGIRTYLGPQKSQKIAVQLEALLPEKTVGVPSESDAPMPVLEIDGVDYVALLEIPGYGVKLPVSDEWDGKNLYATPSRFSGSTYDNSLIIGGNDLKQFSFCDQIENGAQVLVTDLTGAQFTYTVVAVDRAKHAEAQWLAEEGTDLTLFCADTYSMGYIAVRCVQSY